MAGERSPLLAGPSEEDPRITQIQNLLKMHEHAISAGNQQKASQCEASLKESLKNFMLDPDKEAVKNMPSRVFAGVTLTKTSKELMIKAIGDSKAEIDNMVDSILFSSDRYEILVEKTQSLKEAHKDFKKSTEKLKCQTKIHTAKKWAIYSCCLFAPCIGPYIAYQKHQINKLSR